MGNSNDVFQKTSKTRSELINVGKKVGLETVDFADPNRPKTCIEIDFPILPVNRVSTIEGNVGKPIYQMSKWWARRRPSIFRSILIGAATKAPEDRSEAAKTVWSNYYLNHQSKGNFKGIKVADIFCGGGTTVVEGSRLGMQMYGNDINPVAWFVVKNELANTDRDRVEELFKKIESEVKPQIMPFYSCDCPRGHKGKWLKFKQLDIPIHPFYDQITIDKPSEKDIKAFEHAISSYAGWKEWYVRNGYEFEEMSEDFDPLQLSIAERALYRYWGPEIIYIFWAKYGPCSITGCDHRTPIINSTTISAKAITVKSWSNQRCASCDQMFDVESDDVRMAPGATFVVSEKEKTFTIIDKTKKYTCPKCGQKHNAMKLDPTQLTKKKVFLTLLIHPDWVKGEKGVSLDGINYGGSSEDSCESTEAWNKARAERLQMIEFRGEELPQEFSYPGSNVTICTGSESGTNKGRKKFACGACGNLQHLSASLAQSGKDAPISAYAIQGYCPECSNARVPYNGRFFAVEKETARFDAAGKEWELRKNQDLNDFWPKSSIEFGHQTHQRDNLPHHGYTHWWKMFNVRQLLVLAQIYKAIVTAEPFEWSEREFVLGAFQQYLRNQNMFCFWNPLGDKLEPLFSNNNYHPKSTVIENGVFSKLGRGNWESCRDNALKSIDWAKNPWEIVPGSLTNNESQKEAKSIKVYPEDPVITQQTISCTSSTSLNAIPDNSIDLVITDPPFGDNMQYAELSDFFYVWLRLVLKDKYPDIFSQEYTPKALEAVTNKARHSENPDAFYQRLLTECWTEANRILKPGGILAFTFHHSEDEPWVAVLESLFKAGFYLEATYPIKSDETKGEGQFGSKQIEYDIIHVCRKREIEVTALSWARMRRQVMSDIKQLQTILEMHQNSGLSEADLTVIKRGKALEYYSKHYGKVYVEEGRDFTVKDALVGINQMLDEETDKNLEAPPVFAELITRQFLRIFHKRSEIDRDQMHMLLRGTGVSASDFENLGWCTEVKKTFIMRSPVEIAQEWKGKHKEKISSDYDQVMVLIGASYEGSGINLNDTLNNQSFAPHPALPYLLEWFIRFGGSQDIKNATAIANQIFSKWTTKNQAKVQKQMSLFDLWEQE